MITCQLVYCAPINDLPGVIEGFGYALGIDAEEAFDLLADAARVKNIVVLKVTDAAYGRLVANCNIGVVDDVTDTENDDGFDMMVEVLEVEPDHSLLAVHVVEYDWAFA